METEGEDALMPPFFFFALAPCVRSRVVLGSKDGWGKGDFFLFLSSLSCLVPVFGLVLAFGSGLAIWSS